MSADDVALAVEWAAAEGWNPGLHDAECFRAGDPNGFFIGVWRGEPVACISAVAYGEHLGFIGLYIVKPEFRGRGFGMRVWQHGMDYLRNRNVGLDGVIAQQANYRKSGFRLAYRNIRFQGVFQAVAHDAARSTILNASALPFERLFDYDRFCFPAARERFLAVWLGQPDVIALAAVHDGHVAGYGVLRRCRAGCKIGPLFADSDEIASDLFDALVARMPGEVIVLDVPETHPAAVALAERHGMTSVFETARMYTQEPPAIQIERMFGVTSFELG
ncbi:GNAT family N-acetyltransferase [Paraburkholderia domus]|nr:GNAT family N-acetyltransferase [Paraburkholderia domus]MBK5049207.1 GNAT family N-acetyltransferase [Burkholderia sp. R-70006]MBK5060176.1 GNAT family N-acetyltransferase [Burkholderia sp. R-70199]MBK5085192.1 GNAT family N-acetyltransferase [Burkholderia sp. R-69927]MBK5118440.1 GNAT family N-acetyltransferase [Burkholderia sp. R-69980]MBK5164278.1 GNAT family N-acetyltransferase [Burkholderia sp. R-70211]